MRSFPRRFALLPGLLLALATLVTPALAGQAVFFHGRAATRFVGQVAALSGPEANPAGFTLALKTGRLIDMRIAPQATFHAQSAEAEVEGFQVGDYAVVIARRENREWVAYSIQFDVQPIAPVQVTLTGTVAAVSKNGLRLGIRLDTGVVRTVIITVNTKFRVDGQPSLTPPAFVKGEAVQAVARRTPRGLVALEIDLRTASPLRSS